jgi:hypothetical protein
MSALRINRSNYYKQICNVYLVAVMSLTTLNPCPQPSTQRAWDSMIVLGHDFGQYED